METSTNISARLEDQPHQEGAQIAPPKWFQEKLGKIKCIFQLSLFRGLSFVYIPCLRTPSLGPTMQISYVIHPIPDIPVNTTFPSNRFHNSTTQTAQPLVLTVYTAYVWRDQTHCPRDFFPVQAPSPGRFSSPNSMLPASLGSCQL